MLELIVRQPDQVIHETPILFIHGEWHGAWSWDEYFMPYFASHGFTTYALSLRGHGKSTGVERLRWASDHVKDLAEGVSKLPQPPILVGYSLGRVDISTQPN